MTYKKRCCDCKYWCKLSGECSAPLPESVTENARKPMAWDGGAKCRVWCHDGLPIGDPGAVNFR